MAEATLNAIKSAQYQINGNVRLSCNITTPEGEIWDTDFVVDPTREPPIEPLGGLQGAVERWVAANPGEILPFSAEEPPARNEPNWENPPPVDPGPPPWVDPGPPIEPPVDTGPPIDVPGPMAPDVGVDPNIEPAGDT